MKDVVAKLKGLDYKQLVLDHGEKFVLGVVVVLVIVCLGETKWKRYERMPEEFDQQVSLETANLAASKWPDEKRQKIESVKVVSVAVEQLLSEVSVDRFGYRTPMDHPIYKKKEKIKEPKYRAVQDLIVHEGRLIFRERPEGPVTVNQTPLADAGNVNPTANPNTAPPGGGQNAPRTRPGAANNAPIGPAAGDKGLGPVAGQSPVGLGGVDEEELGDTVQVKARALRYNAVRGVFPNKEQIDQYARAMNESVPARAGQLIVFWDFVLERKTAIAGPDPWAGKWEKVDIQVALDILDKVDDFDIDKVDASLTDAVFTAPLPLRVAGYWGSHATHPRIKTLTEEQAEQQALLIQKTVEAQQKANSSQGDRKNGFAGRQHDVRSIRQNMTQDRAIMVERAAQKAYGAEGYQSFTGDMAGGQNRQLSMDGAKLASAGRLLLFRYLDFDIEPGNAYRYRVQLVLKNPNYERSIVDLVDPSSAAGETRKTPFSAPSTAVYVKNDTKFFLTKIKRASGRNNASATIDVFQWSAETGTTMYTEEKLKDLEAGEFIAAFTREETKTIGRGANKEVTTKVKGGLELEVLRPANETFKVEPNVNFVTQNTLVDIATGYALNPGDHADLKLQPTDSKRIRTASQRPVWVASQAVIVDKFGNLAALDNSSSSQDAWTTAKNRLSSERTPWNFLKERNKEDDAEIDELGALAEQFGDEGAGGKKKKKSRRSRRSNPLRRTGQTPSLQPGGLPSNYPGAGAPGRRGGS